MEEIRNEAQTFPGPHSGRRHTLRHAGRLRQQQRRSGDSPASTPYQPTVQQLSAETEQTVRTPKYVFLFIGDGMSYPQIQSTSDFLGALNDADYLLAGRSQSGR